MITVCPLCDSAQIGRRTPGEKADTKYDWLCRECDHRFDDPKERDPKHSQDGGSSLKTKLLNADPDDI